MILDNLSPQRVFYYFEQICAIPHGSGDTDRISAYCAKVAEGLGLDYLRDSWNNIIIRKPASAGYEDHPTVILQGHLDMVCEKEADCPIDFTTEGLTIDTDGEWVFAKGTTLGGDDGIAVAMALAILEDDTIPHPALEAVFTTDEETGMFGAAGIDPAQITGRVLLNADSECEGVLTVSCAGGARARIEIPLGTQENAEPCKTIVIKGLLGGHSGVEINRGRTNADILLGHLLKALPQSCKAVSLSGGTKDNAIPNRALCTVTATEDLTEILTTFTRDHRTETDSGLTLELLPAEPAPRCFTREATEAIASFLTTVPNGVQKMSEDIPDLVETSLNLGQFHCENGQLKATFSVRSSVNAQKEALLKKLRAVAESFGGIFESNGSYPAWEYRKNSPLRDTMVAVYRDLYGKDPVVEAIHAGLECGFFCEKLPGLDAVSFGPDMPDIHTPKERMNVASVQRTYRYLCEILKNL